MRVTINTINKPLRDLRVLRGEKEFTTKSAKDTKMRFKEKD